MQTDSKVFSVRSNSLLGKCWTTLNYQCNEQSFRTVFYDIAFRLSLQNKEIVAIQKSQRSIWSKLFDLEFLWLPCLNYSQYEAKLFFEKCHWIPQKAKNRIVALLCYIFDNFCCFEFHGEIVKTLCCWILLQKQVILRNPQKSC